MVCHAAQLHCVCKVPGPKALYALQFDNAWNGAWLSFCAAREVADAMIADANKGTMLVFNGDISYAQ